MKILIVNKFYYRRGGDCVYVLNLEELLRSHGHDVAIYAMTYPENIPSVWSPYFAPEINFNKGKLKGMLRTLGYAGVKKSFGRLLADFKPDVVHFNNIHSYLSPEIVKLASEAGAKVVWTMHDYKLVCPAYSCLRDGKICEDCFDDPKAVIKTRCMKGSLPASVLAYAEARRWNIKSLSEWTDVFLCPSRFMAMKMADGGYPPEKLFHLFNFISPAMLAEVSAKEVIKNRDDYYCYVGRLSKEKGVRTLLRTASKLPFELRVAGDGPLGVELRREFARYDNIRFLGHLGAGEIGELLANARFSVVPSEWYENNPFSVIESLCLGTPFVGADIGGIPELRDATNGIIFTAGDTNSLRFAIEEAWGKDWDYAAIRRDALEKFSPERHYQVLNKIYGN